ncbi:rhamnulokinase [Coriobacterium glomerans PW2]|uniref:Rhamnulokinase n=1 Tax=Coriobacterium glomerans (strain ATCC 49209 / DSM 20642 / JCM 10262 / PW2) TaxID=700015 RepID=F2NBC9_CORGP|nr:rhamnulokinase family protein [Coriobacterium glomerans]AEB06665.1 rhamnulokinase [Coriobacterium glomerans PW2]
MTDCSDTKRYAAVDIGASTGRVLVGWLEDGRMRLEEAHRFDNSQIRVGGHNCWDMHGLFENMIEGLRKAGELPGGPPGSIGIDTWGVDFVLLDRDRKMIGEAVSYRDARCNGMCEVVEGLIAPEDLFARTGIQRQLFNTVYQLMALKKEHPEQLAAARHLLMIPDYLNFLLTGRMRTEYTNATTTGLLNARSRDWDRDLLDLVGLPPCVFERPVMPGVEVGEFTDEVAARIGYSARVVLPATHDTGSAFLAVPARDRHGVFISSGTWSLLGVERSEPVTSSAALRENFTNEGGYGLRYRFLKNIMGLWMIQSVRREVNGTSYVRGSAAASARFDHAVDFDELRALCRDAEPFEARIDVDDERFLAPDSMISEIEAACRESGQPVPQTLGQIMRTIYASLAACYARSIASLREITGCDFSSINIVGGGCQDSYLNRMTAAATGLPVFAGPIEATAIGNVAAQMIAAGHLDGTDEVRRCVAASFPIERIDPDT